MLDGIIGEFELNIGRFLSTLILTIPILITKKPSLMIAKKNRVPFVLLCAVVFVMNYTSYAATIYIQSGTAMVVYSISFMLSTLLITSITTLYSEGKINWSSFLCDSLTVLLLIAGVVIVIQPELLFVTKPRVAYKSFCNPFHFESINSTAYTRNKTSIPCSVINLHDNSYKDSYMGYLYATGGGFLSMSYLCLGKYLFKTAQPIVVCTWIAIVDIPLSVLCTALFESFVFPKTIFCDLILLCHALCTGLMAVLGFLALGDVPSTDLTVISSLSVPTIFSFQFSLLKNAGPSNSPINTLSIVGAISISLICMIKPLIECIRLHKQPENKYE